MWTSWFTKNLCPRSNAAPICSTCVPWREEPGPPESINIQMGILRNPSHDVNRLEWVPTEAGVNIATGGPCARELPLTRPHPLPPTRHALSGVCDDDCAVRTLSTHRILDGSSTRRLGKCGPHP